MEGISLGSQLRVNNKWFFDVVGINDTDKTITVKFFYKEGISRKYVLAKKIALPQSLITITETKDNVVYVKIDETQLKSKWGNIVNYIEKSPDIYKLIESADGMGAVSMPGLSGVVGQTGSAGSGDISYAPLPASVKPSDTLLGHSTAKKGTYSLIDLSRSKKAIKKSMGTNKSKVWDKTGNGIIRQLSYSDIMKENDTNDLSYKQILYDFLDYPFDNDYDNMVLAVLEEHRKNFINSSSPIIKDYMHNFFNANKSYIKRNCSKEFLNKILILADKEGTNDAN